MPGGHDFAYLDGQEARSLRVDVEGTRGCGRVSLRRPRRGPDMVRFELRVREGRRLS